MPKKILLTVLLFLGLVKGCSLFIDGRVSSYDGIERLSVDTSTPYQTSFLNITAEGKRPVILIHGSPGGAGNWVDFMSTYAGEFHWIAVDRPGFGGTRPKQVETDLNVQADAIAAIFDDLTPEKPIVVGYSLGGPVAAHLAARYPEKIGAVVFAAASLDPGLEDIWLLQQLGRGISWFLPKSLDNANMELMALEGELNALQAVLPQIRIPVAVLHGEKDENVPLENISYLEQRLTVQPVLTHIVKALDHGIPWEGQGALIKLLRELDIFIR